MMKIIFVIFLALHGLIHLMGFTKAFKLGKVEALTQPVSKPVGILWLLATLLFFAVIIMFLQHYNSWRMIAILAVLVSQTLIIFSWRDAKYGTIANLIILIVVIGFPLAI